MAPGGDKTHNVAIDNLEGCPPWEGENAHSRGGTCSVSRARASGYLRVRVTSAVSRHQRGDRRRIAVLRSTSLNLSRLRAWRRSSGLTPWTGIRGSSANRLLHPSAGHKCGPNNAGLLVHRYYSAWRQLPVRQTSQAREMCSYRTSTSRAPERAPPQGLAQRLASTVGFRVQLSAILRESGSPRPNRQGCLRCSWAKPGIAGCRLRP